VPGGVHTDLLVAGLIPDPYLDDNQRLLSWIGDTDCDRWSPSPQGPGESSCTLKSSGPAWRYY
jgi:beta-mannosidase